MVSGSETSPSEDIIHPSDHTTNTTTTNTRQGLWQQRRQATLHRPLHINVSRANHSMIHRAPASAGLVEVWRHQQQQLQQLYTMPPPPAPPLTPLTSLYPSGESLNYAAQQQQQFSVRPSSSLRESSHWTMSDMLNHGNAGYPTTPYHRPMTTPTHMETDQRSSQHHFSGLRFPQSAAVAVQMANTPSNVPRYTDYTFTFGLSPSSSHRTYGEGEHTIHTHELNAYRFQLPSSPLPSFHIWQANPGVTQRRTVTAPHATDTSTFASGFGNTTISLPQRRQQPLYASAENHLMNEDQPCAHHRTKIPRIDLNEKETCKVDLDVLFSFMTKPKHERSIQENIQLCWYLETLFSSIHQLSMAFIHERTSGETSRTLWSLDDQRISRLYQLIAQDDHVDTLKQNTQEDMMESNSSSLVHIVNISLTRLLYILQQYQPFSDDRISALLAIIYMNPNLSTVEDREAIITPLVDLCLKLSPLQRVALCTYLTPLSNDNVHTQERPITTYFSHAIHLLKQHIADVLKRPDALSPNKEQRVCDTVRCMEIFHRFNQEYELLPFHEFYSAAISERINVREDYSHFRAHHSFFYYRYPFILNATVKGQILQVENMVQMRHELQDAFFRALFIGVNNPYLSLEVRRSEIIQDTLNELERKSVSELRKQLKVQFVGEDAVDEGGVQKEFFQLLVREMFDEKYGMFIWSEETGRCWFPRNLNVDEDVLKEYKLIGRLIGLAIYNAVMLDIHLPMALYKKLLGHPMKLVDLRSVDPSMERGLSALLEMDDEQLAFMEQTYQIEYECFGRQYTYDLIPNGASVPVTRENCRDFVDRYVHFLLNTSVSKPFHAFKEGFDELCGKSAIQIFRPEELEMIVCGSQEMDFHALESATKYDGGFNADTPVIRYFWKVVHALDDERKKKLLFFATGTDRIPLGGLGKLSFTIARNGSDSDRLPTAHTCFNILLLPEYASMDKLKDRLLTAINNSEGFGMI